MRWLDCITDSMDMNLSKLQDRDMETWHAVIHGVTESDTAESLSNTMALRILVP